MLILYRTLFFCLPGLVLLAQAASPLQAGVDPGLKSRKGVINISAYADVLSDKTGRLTLTDVKSEKLQPLFKPNQAERFSLQPGVKDIWIRLDTNRPVFSGRRIMEVSSSVMGRVTVYQTIHQKSYKLLMSGPNDTDPNRARRIRFRHYAFHLPQSGSIYYLRVHSAGPEVFSLRLFTEDAFRAYIMYDYLLFGLIYGIMLGMAAYNFFIFISLKKAIYLSYVLYMVSFLAYLMLYNGQAALPADMGPDLEQMLEWFFLGISIFFSISFCRQFFKTKTYTPFWDKMLYLIQAASLFIIAFGFLGLSDMAAMTANACGIVGPVNVVIVGLIRHRQRFSPARHFILANLFFCISTFGYVTWLMGVLPMWVPGEIIFSLGPGLEALFLSFALAERIRMLEVQSALYKKDSETDGLTGLYNKKYLMERLTWEIRKEQDPGPDKRCLSFIIMDVDNFKAYNDTYGHPEGDKVLQALAEVITSCVREEDRACRYGGEEFAVVLPDTGLPEARIVAERIRSVFATRRFKPKADFKVTSSISVGLAQWIPGEGSDQLIKRADQALYQAKGQGKNRVISST